MEVRFGAYGKIPGLGDFLRIGLGPGFARGWDGWMQETLTTARAGLGGRWTDCYMTAPIWRYTLSGGTLGDAQVLGVMMPSVDRVGRQFPLTLAAELATRADVSPVALHLASETCFEALENLALDALEDGMDRAALVARLETLPPPVVPQGLASLQSGGALLCTAGDACGLAWALGTALTARLGTTLSLWSCLHGDAQRLMTLPGLPGGDLAAALFDPAHGAWAAMGRSG